MERTRNCLGWLSFVFIMITSAMLIASCGGARKSPEDISVIPVPVSLERGDGDFVIRKNTGIFAYSDDERVRSVVTLLIGKLEGYSGKTAIETGGKAPGVTPDNNIILTTSAVSSDLGEEGYELTIGEKGVFIRANTAAGLFYGVQTLFQLMPDGIYGGEATWPIPIPCVTIKDVPRFSWRGMHLDVSRHFFPKETVMEYIDLLAMHKMNVFHWHLTDGTGWRIEIKRYPRLTEYGAWRKDTTGEPWSFTNIWQPEPGGKRYGGFYTQDEIREIVRYAADRFITVVPEIEMPGHASAALAAYPEYLCVNAEETNREYGNSGVFCAGKDETFDFLEGVLDEVIALFPSEYIHIGGDEVPKRFWEACPDCQARMKRENLKDEEELQSWFIRRIERYLVSRGKKLVGWDEILEGGLAPEATVMSWRGMNGGVEAARANHDVVMTPEGSCYFNLYQGDPDLEPAAWGGFLPLGKVYEFDPVPEELSAPESKHVIGAQGCLWTEYIETPDMIEYMLVPRISALAEVVWTQISDRNMEDFKIRMIRQYGRFDAMGLNYAKSAYNVGFDITVDPASFDAMVLMKSDAAGTEIRYTLDGSDPTSSSDLYTGSVVLDETAHVAALSFMNGVPAGKVTSVVYNRHKAAGKKPELTHRYSSQYPGAGDYTLTNCLMGSKNYADGQWQGFLGNDLVASIDLGADTPIGRISSTYFHNPGVWIFQPSSVEYAISGDGVEYKTIAVVKNETPMQTPGPIIVAFEEFFDDVSARYIRIKADNIGVCPDWHAGSGGAAWMFADEIVVE